jgi:hypothetical protein
MNGGVEPAIHQIKVSYLIYPMPEQLMNGFDKG